MGSTFTSTAPSDISPVKTWAVISNGHKKSTQKHVLDFLSSLVFRWGMHALFLESTFLRLTQFCAALSLWAQRALLLTWSMKDFRIHQHFRWRLEMPESIHNIDFILKWQTKGSCPIRKWWKNLKYAWLRISWCLVSNGVFMFMDGSCLYKGIGMYLCIWAVFVCFVGYRCHLMPRCLGTLGWLFTVCLLEPMPKYHPSSYCVTFLWASSHRILHTSTFLKEVFWNWSR